MSDWIIAALQFEQWYFEIIKSSFRTFRPSNDATHHFEIGKSFFGTFSLAKFERVLPL